MMNLETICDELRRLGVREVILEVDKEGIPFIDFHGFDGEHFHVRGTNAEFAEHDL